MGTRLDFVLVRNMLFFFPVKITCCPLNICSILRVTYLQVLYALKFRVSRREVRELFYKFYSY